MSVNKSAVSGERSIRAAVDVRADTLTMKLVHRGETVSGTAIGDCRITDGALKCAATKADARTADRYAFSIGERRKNLLGRLLRLQPRLPRLLPRDGSVADDPGPRSRNALRRLWRLVRRKLNGRCGLGSWRRRTWRRVRW